MRIPVVDRLTLTALVWRCPEISDTAAEEFRGTYYGAASYASMELAQFLEFLEDQAGDSLRAVEWYREDEAELIYLRDDLELTDVQRRADEIHQNLTWEWSPPESNGLRDLGEELATVSLREEAVLVHLPVEDSYGVIVGLDPAAARSLHRFVMDCRESLDDVDPSDG